MARLEQLIEASREGRRSSDSSMVRGFVYTVRVIIQVVTLWFRDRCPQKAASLAFTSALSLVPVLGVALAALKLTGAFEAQSSFVDFVTKQVLPDIERDEIVKQLLEFTSAISLKNVGIPGLLGTLFVAFMLFYSIEENFNDIWRIDRHRSIPQKFLIFYCLFTLVPPLLGYSLYHAAIVTENSPVGGYLMAAAGSLGALFLTNKLLPATRVLFFPALVGSLFGAAFLELGKLGFRLYVSQVAFESYSGIYGRFGLVPIFLVWIYVSWLIVLLSAEISHAMQNLPALEAEKRRGSQSDAELLEKVNGFYAARMLVAVAHHYQAGGKALRRADLCKRFDVSEDVVERIFRRLKERHLAIEVEGELLGYLPARPASEISLGEVLAAFRSSDPLGAIGNGLSPRLERLFGDIDSETRQRVGPVTIEDLIEPEPDEGPASIRPAPPSSTSASSSSAPGLGQGAVLTANLSEAELPDADKPKAKA